MTKHHLLWPILLAACIGEAPTPGGDDGGGDDDPAACVQARTYAGFGGSLEGDRAAIAAGSDRLRVKPFAALAAEYTRALGLATFDTSAYAATFGKPPARWYAEPQASANTIYAAFALAYDACTQHTATGAMYGAAPDATAADQICRDLVRRAWNRDATADEASTCAAYAVSQTDPADAPRKRWAYSCAAVLSASGFLAY